jgi:hypothetical protein
MPSVKTLCISFRNLTSKFWISVKKEFPDLSKGNTTSATFHLNVLVGSALIVPSAIKTKQESRLLVEADLRWSKNGECIVQDSSSTYC